MAKAWLFMISLFIKGYYWARESNWVQHPLREKQNMASAVLWGL